MWLDLRVADDQIAIGEVEDAFLRTYGRAVAFITFCRRACLIKKQMSPAPRDVDAGEPLAAMDTASQCLAVSIRAHLAYVGDVIGTDGYINSSLDTHTFQGFAIECDGDLVEYRVRLEDGSWSDWTRSGGFAGTRGQSKPLTAFTVRLLDYARPQYSLRSFGRFVGAERPVEAADGQDCISVSGGALRGIQVDLTRHFG